MTIVLGPGIWACLTLMVVSFSGCPGEVPTDGSAAPDGSSATDGSRPTVAYVTNGIADFWKIGEAGAKKAGEEFDVNVEIRMPPDGIADQQRMIEELLVMDVDGIAVSPIDPENQTSFLNMVAEQTNLVTQDADAPESGRLCYIGMGNYDAGRMCGELVRSALPDGGEIMIFVGRLEQINAQQRRQGLIDELLEREYDSNREPDPTSEVLEHGKFKILGTRTDGFDYSKAKSQAEDALAAYPELDCLVGLFEYNPPKILEALKGAGKLGKVQLVGFDENTATLKAIQEGTCYGTVVQNPYQYGYQSVKVLAGLARGDKSVLPPDGFLDLPGRKITQENVEEFQAELQALIQ